MGFSTGTAAAAAARAALRLLLTGEAPESVSVRLPDGTFLIIPVVRVDREGEQALGVVVKDGGDDPDVTHKAEVMARVGLVAAHDGLWGGCGQGGQRGGRREPDGGKASLENHGGVLLRAGVGVGCATKPGLPVRSGEPAINPVPRRMMVENLYEELVGLGSSFHASHGESADQGRIEGNGNIFLPFPLNGASPEPPPVRVSVEISVPKGEEMARHTLNPRLGVVGGISILGTTGRVKPFSHKAYEETIDTGLSVARATGCGEVVLSTGGKSEKLAQKLLPHLPVECFIEIADFFAFGVREAVRMGFGGVVHSVFFGKAVKMAQGHPYTHAHRVALDLDPVARLVLEKGYGQDFSREIAQCNTARHALDLLLEKGAPDVVRAVAHQAREQSLELAGRKVRVRVLVFDHHGELLADTEKEFPCRQC